MIYLGLCKLTFYTMRGAVRYFMFTLQDSFIQETDISKQDVGRSSPFSEQFKYKLPRPAPHAVNTPCLYQCFKIFSRAAPRHTAKVESFFPDRAASHSAAHDVSTNLTYMNVFFRRLVALHRTAPAPRRTAPHRAGASSHCTAPCHA